MNVHVLFNHHPYKVRMAAPASHTVLGAGFEALEKIL
jgi:hypothetical protein